MLVLGAAVLLLASFEAVFVANVVHRLSFGPPLPNISGYAYSPRFGLVEPATFEMPALIWLLVPFAALAASAAVAWLVGRLHRAHYALSIVFVAASVMLCAVLNVRAPFVIQFLTMLTFVTGLLAAARVTDRPRHHALLS